MDPNDLGPYRATKLWTDAVNAFRNGMPLKRHWRHMRAFDNCFTANEAIDWLHSHLQKDPNFGPEVTRIQTVQLLQKFLKCHVFQSIGGNCVIKPEEFSETKFLYKFVQGSPFKLLRTSPKFLLRDRTNDNVINTTKKINIPGNDKQPQQHSVSRKLSVQEVEEIWKSVILNRLQSALGLPEIIAILDTSSVNPKFIIHNMTQVNKSGIVIVLDKAFDLPHWVISAMKCLMLWPNACSAQNCLPQYEGFVYDVFNVVKDYFQNQSTPLSTYAMYDVFINCLVRADYLDVGSRPASLFGSYLPAELSSFESVENFMNDIVPKNRAKFSDFKTSTPCLTSLNSCSCHICMETSNQPSTIKKENDKKVTQQWSQNHLNMCYETAFTSADPITRIIPEYNFLPTNCNMKKCPCVNFNSAKEPTNFKPLIVGSENSSIMSPVLCTQTTATVKNDRLLRRLRSKSGGYYNLAYLTPPDESHSDGSSSGSYYTAEEEPVNNVADKILSDNGGRFNNENPSSNKNPCFCNSSSCFTANDHFCTTSNSWIMSNSKTTSDSVLLIAEGLPRPVSPDILKRHAVQEWVEKACWPDLFSDAGKECAIEVLQLVSLLLPPSNRRKLHLLLRFMNKLANNYELVLSNKIPTRILVLQTFLHCIVNSARKEDYDELLALRLVMFLMDHYERIFAVPQTLKEEIEKKLTNEKILYTTDDLSSITYCEQVSNGEYAKQSIDHSRKALVDLLERIIQDEQLPQKIKKKHLKQFKLLYPDIYKQRFSSPQEENVLLKAKSKNNSRSSLLQRLKIRL